MLSQIKSINVTEHFPFDSNKDLADFVSSVQNDIENFLTEQSSDSRIEFFLQNGINDNPALFFIVFALILDELIKTKPYLFPEEVIQNYSLVNEWKGIYEHEMEHITLSNHQIPISIMKVKFLIDKDPKGILNFRIASEFETTRYGQLISTLAPKLLSYGDIINVIQLINGLPFPESFIALGIFKKRLHISWKDAVYLSLFFNFFSSRNYQQLLKKVFLSQFE